MPLSPLLSASAQRIYVKNNMATKRVFELSEASVRNSNVFIIYGGYNFVDLM